MSHHLFSNALETTAPPALFFGHGSPMNAIEDNDFTRFLKSASNSLITPKAILVISAHWETIGSKVLSHPTPKTIHDFGGFPEALYQIQYPAPGSPELAQSLVPLGVQADESWGLDHGTWSVLKHLYPKPTIPVIQLSIDRSLSLREHYERAQSLRSIRKRGVMVVGSGNITHNLRQLDWSQSGRVSAWATEFDEAIKSALIKKDLSVLFGEKGITSALWKQAHPSLEHYIPLLYVLGISEESEALTFLFEGFQMGSLSMRSLQMG